ETELLQRFHEIVEVIPLLRVVLRAQLFDWFFVRVSGGERHVPVRVLGVGVQLDQPAGEEARRSLAAYHALPERGRERLGEPTLEQRPVTSGKLTAGHAPR